MPVVHTLHDTEVEQKFPNGRKSALWLGGNDQVVVQAMVQSRSQPPTA